MSQVEGSTDLESLYKKILEENKLRAEKLSTTTSADVLEEKKAELLSRECAKALIENKLLKFLETNCLLTRHMQYIKLTSEDVEVFQLMEQKFPLKYNGNIVLRGAIKHKNLPLIKYLMEIINVYLESSIMNPVDSSRPLEGSYADVVSVDNQSDTYTISRLKYRSSDGGRGLKPYSNFHYAVETAIQDNDVEMLKFFVENINKWYFESKKFNRHEPYGGYTIGNGITETNRLERIKLRFVSDIAEILTKNFEKSIQPDIDCSVSRYIMEYFHKTKKQIAQLYNLNWSDTGTGSSNDSSLAFPYTGNKDCIDPKDYYRYSIKNIAFIKWMFQTGYIDVYIYNNEVLQTENLELIRLFIDKYGIYQLPDKYPNDVDLRKYLLEKLQMYYNNEIEEMKLNPNIDKNSILHRKQNCRGYVNTWLTQALDSNDNDFAGYILDNFPDLD